METTFPAGSGTGKKEFKSYYVVWKLLYYYMLFKSFSMFKSYYVVWKRKRYAQVKVTGAGLNRTMQYGNLFFKKK